MKFTEPPAHNVVALLLVIEGFEAKSFTTFNDTVFETTSLHPLTRTRYCTTGKAADGETLIDKPLPETVFQVRPLSVDASQMRVPLLDEDNVNVTAALPTQYVVEEIPKVPTVAAGVTVMVVPDETTGEHGLLVMRILYVVVTEGETLNGARLPRAVQVLPLSLLNSSTDPDTFPVKAGVRVTLEPAHTVADDAVNVAVATGATYTVHIDEYTVLQVPVPLVTFAR